jgi:hypothetical protein
MNACMVEAREVCPYGSWRQNLYRSTPLLSPHQGDCGGTNFPHTPSKAAERPLSSSLLARAALEKPGLLSHLGIHRSRPLTCEVTLSTARCFASEACARLAASRGTEKAPRGRANSSMPALILWDETTESSLRGITLPLTMIWFSCRLEFTQFDFPEVARVSNLSAP